MRNLIALPILFVLASCTNLQNVQTVLGPPDQVQLEVAALGAAAKSEIPSKYFPQIHQFGTALAGATAINSTILIGLIPHTGNAKTDALITAGAVIVNLALSKYGTTDPTVLSYAHAVGNGLLINF